MGNVREEAGFVRAAARRSAAAFGSAAQRNVWLTRQEACTRAALAPAGWGAAQAPRGAAPFFALQRSQPVLLVLRLFRVALQSAGTVDVALWAAHRAGAASEATGARLEKPGRAWLPRVIVEPAPGRRAPGLQ